LPGFESVGALEAKIAPISPTMQWVYTLRDHLGNSRVQFSDLNNDGFIAQATEVLSMTQYSPFGLELGGSHQNRAYQDAYKYNGKEHHAFTGYYDYGARWSDPTIGNRFLQGDPMSELDFHLTPYAYVGNNPLSFIDPTGMKRVNIEGTNNWYDDETWELNIVGKRPKSDPVFGNLYIQYARNEYLYGHSSPYQEHFQAGARDAVLIIGAPIAAIGAAEASVGALIFDSELLTSIKTLSFGRGLLRSMLAKGGGNILGQSVGGMLSGDFAKGMAKFDMVGLFADMTFTNAAASVTGGVGEGGIMYDSKNGLTTYGTVNSPFLGLSKFGVGFGFGHIGGKATEIMGANGVSNAVIGLYESMSKIFNESIDQINSKFDQKINPEKK
jgi:RHS repeat-associated protein